jgi:hypothetical protein
MTSKIESHNALIRELNDGDLDRVSGSTSGMMHAVAAAAYKVILDTNALKPNTFGQDLSEILGH